MNSDGNFEGHNIKIHIKKGKERDTNKTERIFIQFYNESDHLNVMKTTYASALQIKLVVYKIIQQVTELVRIVSCCRL